MRKIGFSHGDLFKIHDVYTKENIQLFKDSGCNVIEVNAHHVHEVERLDSILPFINDFAYISMHVPCDCRYGDNQATREVLRKLENFYIKAKAQLAVVHPDLVDNWEVFKEFKMRWAIENMDDRKEKFKDVNDLSNFFEQHNDWQLVLDVGHCNANDKTMALAYEMILNFQDRIAEIHLSGYEKFHDPLHRTRQLEIINACKKLDVPIIIESVFELSDGIAGVKKEFDYITENL